jgi:hypothetical protein
MVMMFSLSCVGVVVVVVVCWSLADAGSLPTGGFAENTPSFAAIPLQPSDIFPPKTALLFSVAVRVLRRHRPYPLA